MMSTTPRPRRPLGRALAACAAAAVLCGFYALGTRGADDSSAAAAPASQPSTRPAAGPATQPAIQIDLDKAVTVKMPDIKEDLSAAGFKTADGKDGWVIRIPGNRPIATPAYAKIDGRGMLFVGGGYGSHEFYAFDADTGQVVWKMATGDDGPTAAVVEDVEGTPYVAFNTESCTVIIADARTGKVIWQEWLGDPLMSQPAISKGRLFIAYPGGNPRGVQKGDAAGPAPGGPPANGAQQQLQQGGAATDISAALAQIQKAADKDGPKPIDPAAAANAPAVQVFPATGPATAPAGAAAAATGHGHRLLCCDLRTGKHLWEQDITGDVISAPVVEGDQVLFTCFDGTSFCLKAADGAIVWKKANAGTSAPIVADGQVVITQKQVAAAGGQVQEGIKRLDPKQGEEKDKVLLAGGDAEYLKQGKAGNVALSPDAQKAHDSTVGFAQAPASAGLDKAQAHLNLSTVAGGWAYQGARAAYGNGGLINAQGNMFNCLDSPTGQVRWRATCTGKDVTGDVQAFAPPALGAKNLYVCSARGHLLSLDQKTGKLAFAYATDQPMAFQPALAAGNVYAGTANGLLVCLKTGDKDADGWTAWGGNAQHNKKQ